MKAMPIRYLLTLTLFASAINFVSAQDVEIVREENYTTTVPENDFVFLNAEIDTTKIQFIPSFNFKTAEIKVLYFAI